MNKPAFTAIKSHSPNKPVLIFVASRRQTRLTSLDLIQLCGMEDNPRRFLKMDETELQQVLTMVKDDTLKLSLQFGIGLHHAGLVGSDRRISHELFASNKIQILVATSTLAWGVNLPAYLVIIKGTQFFDAKIEGYKDMDLTDVLQMMGRAGRPAFDTKGVAMVYTKESTKGFYKYFLNSGFPVESSLHKMMEDHLGAEITSKSISSKQKALDFLMWTFLYRRIHHNPSYYGIEETSEESINSWVVDLVEKSVANLEESGCVKLFDNGDLEATPFLKIASYYYLSHKTMRYFLRNMKRSASFQDCLIWLCSATEYDELPVRHNEDLINVEMSKELRYPGEIMNLVMWDPHVKAFLLLQAFMSRVELPIADYVQDTVSVLDQSLRILQAAVDTAAELGYLSTCLTLIQVMQCIKQAYWYDDDPITALPGLSLKPRKIEESKSPVFHSFFFETIKTSSNNAQPDLATIARAGNDLDRLASQLGVKRSALKDFKRVASTLPDCDITTRLDEASNKLTVRLQHVNTTNAEFKVYSPRFPKTQKESWFLILGLQDEDEVIALTRISPRAQNHSKFFEASLNYDSKFVGKQAYLYCVNDALELFEVLLVDI